MAYKEFWKNPTPGYRTHAIKLITAYQPEDLNLQQLRLIRFALEEGETWDILCAPPYKMPFEDVVLYQARVIEILKGWQLHK